MPNNPPAGRSKRLRCIGWWWWTTRWLWPATRVAKWRTRNITPSRGVFVFDLMHGPMSSRYYPLAFQPSTPTPSKPKRVADHPSPNCYIFHTYLLSYPFHSSPSVAAISIYNFFFSLRSMLNGTGPVQFQFSFYFIAHRHFFAIKIFPLRLRYRVLVWACHTHFLPGTPHRVRGTGVQTCMLCLYIK